MRISAKVGCVVGGGSDVRATRLRVACFRATVMLGSLLAATCVAALDASSVRISIPKGAAIQDVVRELAAAVGGACVADVGIQDRRLQKALVDATLDEALASISIDFDRYWIRRDRTIALQLRRTDIDEAPGVELEELRLAGGDIARLLRVIPRHEGPGEWTALRSRFVASISPEQRERMLTGGLHFRDLSRDQQRFLVSLNLEHRYDAPARELERAELLLGRIDQAVLVPVWNPRHPRASQDPTAGRSLLVKLAAPQAPGGAAGVIIGITGDQEAAERVVAPLLPAGEEAAVAVARRPSGRALQLPTQEYSLADFAVEWRRATGSPLRTPAYAADRRFWVCSTAARRYEVAQSLADLWQWETTAERDGRWLRRPTYGPAQDAVDLHRKLRWAVPPPVWHAATNVSIRHDARRRTADVRRIWLHAERAEGVGAEFPASRLDDGDRMRLAAAVLTRQVQEWHSATAGRDAPPAYVSAPFQIILTLDGPLDGGTAPTIWVRGPDGAWGWPARSVPPSPRELIEAR